MTQQHNRRRPTRTALGNTAKPDFAPDKSYTISEAAQILGASRSFLEKQVRDGRIAKLPPPPEARFRMVPMRVSGKEMIRFREKGPRERAGHKVNENLPTIKEEKQND